MTKTDALPRGRAAFHRLAWSEAYALFEAASSEAPPCTAMQAAERGALTVARETLERARAIGQRFHAMDVIAVAQLGLGFLFAEAIRSIYEEASFSRLFA